MVMKRGTFPGRLKPHMVPAVSQTHFQRCATQQCKPSISLSSSRRAVVASASPPNGQKQKDSSAKNSMPQLPPRKPKQPGSSTRSGSTGGRAISNSDNNPPRRKGSPTRLGSSGSMPELPPPESQAVVQEKALAGLLAYTGLMGTVATAIAFFNPDVDLFGNFHWSPSDILLALKLMAPVYALNVLIMLPDYSRWSFPKVTEESTAQMAKAIADWSDQKKAKTAKSSSSSSSDAAVPASAASVTGMDAADAACNSNKEAAAADAGRTAADSVGQPMLSASEADTSPFSTDEDLRPVVALGPISVWETARMRGGRGSSSSIGGGEQDSNWFSQALNSPLFSKARDALFLAQGHYLSLNPAVVLPSQLQLPVLLADVLAAELLYRSVALQVAGGWLGDRMYEAGAEDAVNSAISGLPVLPTHTAGQLAAVLLLSSVWGVMVWRNMQRMTRRPQRMLQKQGKQAAGQLLDDMRDSMRQTRQESRQSGSSNSTTTAPEQDSSSSSSASSNQPGRGRQQPSASRTAADLALAAAKAAEQQQQQRPPTSEPEWSRRLPSTLSALALSQGVQGLRDIGQMTALGLGFVLTGNLAAPFAAALVNQLLMSALQKHGIERARQKSIAMAKHLSSISRQLRDIKRRKDAEKQQQQQQQQQQQSEEQRQHTAAANALDEAVGGVAVSADAPAAEGRVGSDNATAARTAAAAAAAATSLVKPTAPGGSAAEAASRTADSSVHSPGVLSAASRTDPAAAAKPADAIVSSRMEQTVNLLDALLGQMGEHATAGPGSGK